MSIVLVTGAHGLLGSSLVPFLRVAGHSVICVSRQTGTDICADFSILDEAIQSLSLVNPDTIINLAALTDVDACERDAKLAYCANVSIVENIAAWMDKTGINSHLVQISTDQLYDGPGPHNEENVTLTNVYAESKQKAENVAVAVSSTILRTNFFGPSRCAGRASISDWIFTSLSSSKPITVFDDILFSPLSIDTLVRLIELVASQRHKGIFNLGSRDGMSKADFAYALANVLRLPTNTMKRGLSSGVSLRAYRPKDMRMDSTLFENTFAVNLPTLQREVESMQEVYPNVAG